jgi:hypothetical protein
MKTALLKIVVLACLACGARSACAQSEGCTGMRSAIGALIGGAIGSLVLPVIGTAWGAVLAAGGTCGVDAVSAWRADKPSSGAAGPTSRPADVRAIR